MKESEFQGFIVDYAKVRGWLVTHQRGVPVRRKDGSFRYVTPIQGDEGAPDLLMVRNRKGRPQFAHIEVKTEHGYASAEQKAWLNEMVDYDGRWASRGEIPDGAVFHQMGGWTELSEAGDWTVLVALVRPRHKDWLIGVLR